MNNFYMTQNILEGDRKIKIDKLNNLKEYQICNIILCHLLSYTGQVK